MRFYLAVVRTVSQVKNSQSRHWEELTIKMKKQQAPDVPDNSRTEHAVLSDNCSTPH